MTDQGFIASPSCDDYRVAAEHAMSDGDLPQAAKMAAAALAIDPLEEQSLSLLDDIGNCCKDTLESLGLANDSFFGSVAAGARLLAARGRLSEALDRLVQVVTFRPQLPYLMWVPGWLAAIPSAKIWCESEHRVHWQRLQKALSPPFPPMDRRRQNAEAALQILARLVQMQPEERALRLQYADWLQRMGKTDQALLQLRGLDMTGASWQMHALHGGLCLRVGQPETGAASFEQAVALRPDEETLWLDLGDTRLDLGKVHSGLEAYGRALALDPTNRWARLRLAHARALCDGNAGDLATLQGESLRDDLARELLDDAQFTTHRLGIPHSPGLGALFDFCRRVQRSSVIGDAPHFKLRVQRPEPPSLHLAFRMSMLGLAQDSAIISVIADEPTELRLDETCRCWWDNCSTSPVPNAPSPSVSTIAQIQAIAENDFSLEDYMGRAATPTLPSEELAYAGFYPPTPKRVDLQASEWVFRYQVAALLTLASSIRVWTGGAERRLLYELAAGHVDWISAASIVALGATAQRLTEARPEIEDWYARWLAASPAETPYCYEYHLVASWMRLPHLQSSTLQMLWRRRSTLHANHRVARP